MYIIMISNFYKLLYAFQIKKFQNEIAQNFFFIVLKINYDNLLVFFLLEQTSCNNSSCLVFSLSFILNLLN